MAQRAGRKEPSSPAKKGAGSSREIRPRMAYQRISKISLPTPRRDPTAGPSAIITIRYDYAIIVTQPGGPAERGEITPLN